MLGFAILLAFNLLGLFLHTLGVPLPANVLGMILFAAALFAGVVRVEWVEDAATFLLRHLMLFFVPTIVAVVTMLSLIKQQWLSILGGMMASLLASMILTGLIARWLEGSAHREVAATRCGYCFTAMPPAITTHPLFGCSITVICYAAGVALHRRVAWAHALLTTCIALIALLLLAHIPYENYETGGSIVSFFLGPATVALAVPFYKHARQIGRRMPQVLVAVSGGSTISIAAGVAFVYLVSGPREVLLSMVPRGITTPIAIEVCTQLGGLPALTAVLTGVSGLIGAVVGPPLLDLLKIHDPAARGAAMGTAAHGIGTARILMESETAGGVSAMAMAVSGILTAILAVPIHWLMK